MLFYEIEAVRSNFQAESNSASRREMREKAGVFLEKSESLFRKNEQKNMVFVSSARGNKITFAAVIKNNADIHKLFVRYKDMLGIDIYDYKITEVTFGRFNSLLSSANRNDYIYDDYDVLEAFELNDLLPLSGGGGYGEAILKDMDYKTAVTAAEKLYYTEALTPELERIYAVDGKNKPLGHPVHYILQADEREVRNKTYNVLLSALYDNGRLKNKRYAFLNIDENSRFQEYNFNALYRSSEGGAVVIRYINEPKSTRAGRPGDDSMKAICELAYKYKNKVLTVFCLPSDNNAVKEEFLSYWDDTPFIELYEDVVYGQRAVGILKKMASENKIRTDKKLTESINDEKGYNAAALKQIFDKWYHKKMCTSVYPQYKEVKSAKLNVCTAAPKGSAYEQLKRLIGLTSAKEVMDKALNYFKAQKLFAERGLKTERPAMHMVFTGNPGTAKTTVARLFAQIMKENGLLSNGELHEVGRADLVGKYVGHTAPLVKAAFQKAEGGVLFIDEAYSLVDDRDGLFGDEAINTIVQEMENNRKNTVVIFAGYPDKMEGFLNKNPGLRSRIAFHIPFDDYTATELVSIADMIANENKLKLSSKAKQKLCGVFESAKANSDFGNGRYARNVIENAKMSQANRLMKMDYDDITDDDVFTLTEADIDMPCVIAQEKTVKIGFSA